MFIGPRFQRQRHGHAEFGQAGTTADGCRTAACKVQAEKIVKELHQPISS
jgi:hypothetical protein